MICTADNDTKGHLGFQLVSKRGNNKVVAARLAVMIRPTFACRGCLQRHWRDDMDADEARESYARAVAVCDCWCLQCVLDELDGTDHCSDCGADAGKHWTKRCCSGCKKAGGVCNKIFVLTGGLDCCGEQAGFIRRAFEGALDFDDS